jgi:CDP-diacylglycerol--glycerol-3-phosphate 3-phosphatidyltransferase
MKQLPNILTVSRIFLSLVLFFTAPFSLLCMLIYTACGLSDIADGFIVRRTDSTSSLGAKLDSIADLVFTAAALYIFLPVLPYSGWMLYWVIGIAAVRLCSILIGFLKYRSFVILHTISNKAAGFILLLTPFMYLAFGLEIAALVVLIVASLSAVEEAVINITSRSLNRDVKSIFSMKL